MTEKSMDISSSADAYGGHDDGLYAELERQILLLTAEDEEYSFPVVNNKHNSSSKANGSSSSTYSSVVVGGVAAGASRRQGEGGGGGLSLWENEAAAEDKVPVQVPVPVPVPAWLSDIWREQQHQQHHTKGTGVFIPYVVRANCTKRKHKTTGRRHATQKQGE